MLPMDDSSEALLAPEEILEAVAAIGSRDRFEVAYTVYALAADGVTVTAIAAATPRSEVEIEAHVERLVEGGVLAERMPCLVDPTSDGTEYELTEFGRLLFEDGVLALFDAAESVGDGGIGTS